MSVETARAAPPMIAVGKGLSQAGPGQVSGARNELHPGNTQPECEADRQPMEVTRSNASWLDGRNLPESQGTLVLAEDYA